MSKLVLIILIQLLYVPMLTLRTICMVKNLKIFTSIFGFLEALIYIFGLAIVLSGEQSIIEMVVYAFGFGLGLIVGIFVEQKLAIGYTSLHVNINHTNDEMLSSLRDKGFGVTVFCGKGKIGERNRLDILTTRKREGELIKLIYSHEPNAFIISYEPKMFKGGYLTDIMKSRMKLNIRNGLTVDDVSHGFVKGSILKLKKELKDLKMIGKSNL